MMLMMGALAACVVLLVPMAMAGWHLSRNKMLFFGGALFICLALLVHLAPYFPSASSFSSSSSSSSVALFRTDPRSSTCLSLLHAIVWDGDPTVPDTPLPPTIPPHPSWVWAHPSSPPMSDCSFQQLSPPDASDLLNSSWIVVAGDSQARLFSLSLLSLLLPPSEMEQKVKPQLFKRHSNYQLLVDSNGAKLDFVWAPFPTNLTGFLHTLRARRLYPDVLVLSSGLWHMLHYTNASDYGDSLKSLRESVFSLLPISPDFGTEGPVTGSVKVEAPHMFWLGMPTLINSMLNSEEKRKRMNLGMWEAYDSRLRESRLLRNYGGPLMLLDIGVLSRGCGSRCTMDGMHYDGVVYDAALHIMFNALIIESQQQA